MKNNQNNRREFIKSVSFAALALPFVPLGISTLIGCTKSSAIASTSELDLIKANANKSSDNSWSGAIEAPADVSWKTTLANEKEEGIPILISGTIYQADGKTPAPNVLIYLYHTDIKGYYGRDDEPRHGRFRGWMLTDEKGRYEFRSIKPASYPDTTIASHIHMTLTSKSFKEDSVDSILFEGDKFISVSERNNAGKKGGFNPILKFEKDANGIMRGVRDIQLWKA